MEYMEGKADDLISRKDRVSQWDLGLADKLFGYWSRSAYKDYIQVDFSRLHQEFY